MLKFSKFIKEINSVYHRVHDPVHEEHPDHKTEHQVLTKHCCENDYIPVRSTELNEAIEAHSVHKTRLLIRADGGRTAAAGAVVPRHMWEGGKSAGGGHFEGMQERNEARAEVYGPEHRTPLGLNQIEHAHREHLEEHFKKPEHEQIAAEKEALSRLRAAKHLSDGAHTLDKGEKTDTVEHEHDEQGRSFVAMSSKGVAGHAVYTSGSAADSKHHILNTCPQQTEGCGGGIDAHGIADTFR